jgi:predicted ATPase
MQDGVWFVELASITHGSFFASAVAQALSVQESRQRSMIETLTIQLKKKALLLILDNCEHVIAEAAAVSDALLRGCPQLHILVTSRQTLRIAGEHTYRLPSLRTPASSHARGLNAAAAQNYAAVVLFADRARSIDRDFALSDDDAPIVAELCRRLDGIPLAIELAAARINVLSVRELSAKLDERLRLLSGGLRTLPRHQTMRALIDWSYNLLAENERMLLHRVAVFSDGWTLSAAEFVCADAHLHASTILDLLAGLVDKSQVVAERSDGETRYHLLESVREYALEKLAACGERRALAYRHAQWVAALAEHWWTASWSMPRRRWLTSFIPEVDNARSALSWVRENDDDALLSGRIAAGLGGFLYYCGLAEEARRHIDYALKRLADDGQVEVTAILWSTLSALRTGVSRVEAANVAIAIFEQLKNQRRLAVSYFHLAIGYRQTAQFAESEAAIDRALALFRQTGDERSVYYASALGWRASALIGLGRFDEARALFEEDIASFEAIEDEDRAAVERLNLAELEFAAGNVRRSLNLVEEALVVLRAGLLKTNVSNEHSQVAPYLNAAACRLVLGELDEALATARAALARAREMEYPLYTAIAIQHVATIAALRDDAALGARLCGFVDKLFRVEGVQREPTEKRTYEILIHALRQRLSQTDVELLMAEGALLGEAEALRLSSCDANPGANKNT